MKTTPFYALGMSLLGALSMPIVAHSEVILLQQGFDAAVGDTSQALYFVNSSASGTGASVAANPVGTGLSGNGLLFTGTSGNSFGTANFSSVTLSNPGDYISFSYKYAATTNPTGSGSARIGLLNSGGTALASNMFGVGGQSADDIGYVGIKRLSVTTNDYALFKSANSLNSPSFTSIDTGPTSISGIDTNQHSVGLKFTLAANGSDLDVLFSYDGFSTTKTIAGASLTTKTFDEIYFGAGSNNTLYLDNLLVTTNIPEPSSAAMIFGMGVLGVVGGRRRLRSERLVA